MIDYYAELNLDNSLSVDAINKELSRLENTWKRRELNSPEKATKVLALIIDAREVFKSVQTKSNYDRELAESKKPSKPSDPEKQRRDDIQKWKNDAEAYYGRGEYDLAKIAVDRAIALVTDSSDDDIYAFAAVVYTGIGELNTALSFINNAIVTNPQNGLHYLVKADIYAQYAQGYEEERKFLQIGLSAAIAAGDAYAKGRLLGALAFSLYFEQNPDRARAEKLAREALALDENLGSAQRVIEAVNAQRRAEEQAAREKREAEERAAREQEYRREKERKERIYTEALKIAESPIISEKQRAISQLETIIDFKDSRSETARIKEEIQDIENREKKKRRIKKRALAITPIVIIVIIAAYIIHDISFHKCGENARWSLNDGVLTISGTGAIYDFTSNDSAPWHEKCKYNLVRSLVVEEGITEIGNYAFDSYSYGLFIDDHPSVSLPSTLERIGTYGLWGWWNWETFEWSEEFAYPESLELPENLKVIEPYAFRLSELEEINIPASVEYIDPSVFRSSKVKYINVDENNRFYSSIDGVLFNKDQTALIEYPEAQEREMYMIPDSTVIVDVHAFEINIYYSGETYIKRLELGSQTDLSRIWVDPNIDMIHNYNEGEYFQENSYGWPGIENAWSYPGYRNSCFDIESILVSDDNLNYSSVDGILYSKDMSVLYWFPCRSRHTHYQVPDGVVEIAPFAFYGWYDHGCSIVQIELPSSLKKIGGYAFDIDGCNIDEINIPEGVESIGAGAFGARNSGLQRIYLPSTLREVDDGFIRFAYVSYMEDSVQVYYSGTTSDWMNNIDIYEYGEIKTKERGEIFRSVPLNCTDGIIDYTY